jgi:hypothetical protein
MMSLASFSIGTVGSGHRGEFNLGQVFIEELLVTSLRDEKEATVMLAAGARQPIRGKCPLFTSQMSLLIFSYQIITNVPKCQKWS